MKDNFDLKKFLTENKTFENLNPYTSGKGDDKNLNENLRSKIREMILDELGNPDYADNDELEDTYDEEDSYYPHMKDLEDMNDDMLEDDLYEAKKKKDEEEIPEEEVDAEASEEIEDIPGDMPEETPTTNGGLEDIAADMEGTEGDLMNHLMGALKIAKGMNNEKLETQIGNTLKFFVSEYIGGGEQ